MKDLGYSLGQTWVKKDLKKHQHKKVIINSPYAPGPVFGLKRKSPRLNDRKEGNIE